LGRGGEFSAFAVGNYCNGEKTCWSPTYAFERFELDFLAVIRGLPFERFEVAAEGEFIMKRTAWTRLLLSPSVRPISSGEGTRFLMTNAAIETSIGSF
jgi:hypothetical protein